MHLHQTVIPVGVAMCSVSDLVPALLDVIFQVLGTVLQLLFDLFLTIVEPALP